MEVPRPATRLVKENDKLKLVTQENSVDYTDRMLEYSQIDYLASAEFVASFSRTILRLVD